MAKEKITKNDIDDLRWKVTQIDDDNIYRSISDIENALHHVADILEKLIEESDEVKETDENKL